MKYFVLYHVKRAVRFSKIRTLICRSRFLTWFLGECGEEEDQAESCIDLVRWFTALSISSVDFNLILKLIWLSKDNLNFPQSICPRIRLGLSSLLRAAVSIVKRTDECQNRDHLS